GPARTALYPLSLHDALPIYAWPMRLAIAIGCCVALATALDAEAGRGRGGSGGRSHSHASPGFHHGFAHGTRVFVGTSFVAWPPAYYWPGYYYAPPVMPPPQYWYYCAAAGAYHPYVQNCPGGWQLVLPTPPYPGY